MVYKEKKGAIILHCFAFNYCPLTSLSVSLSRARARFSLPSRRDKWAALKRNKMWFMRKESFTARRSRREERGSRTRLFWRVVDPRGENEFLCAQPHGRCSFAGGRRYLPNFALNMQRSCSCPSISGNEAILFLHQSHGLLAISSGGASQVLTRLYGRPSHRCSLNRQRELLRGTYIVDQVGLVAWLVSVSFLLDLLLLFPLIFAFKLRIWSLHRNDDILEVVFCIL